MTKTNLKGKRGNGLPSNYGKSFNEWTGSGAMEMYQKMLKNKESYVAPAPKERSFLDSLLNYQPGENKLLGSSLHNHFTIHAVKVSKSVGLVEANKIAADILKKDKPFMKEMKNVYSFRNISKQKFIPSTYRTRKLNKNVKIIFGELKPEFTHLKGAGIIDDIKEKISNVYDEVKKRGSTLLTGTHYTGPFNALDDEYIRTHPPTDIIDQGAKEHDERYSELAKLRDSGKLSKNETNKLIRDSDNKFLKNIEDNFNKNRWAGTLGYMGIKGKNLLEDYLGLDRNKFVAAGYKRCLKKHLKGCGKFNISDPIKQPIHIKFDDLVNQLQ